MSSETVGIVHAHIGLLPIDALCSSSPSAYVRRFFPAIATSTHGTLATGVPCLPTGPSSPICVNAGMRCSIAWFV